MNEKPTVLVVEDEAALQGAIKIFLERNGINVITAESVDAAKATAEQPGVVSAIWLDHYLQGKENGLDFLAWCRGGDSKYKELPIYIVTNTASSDQVRSYMKFGVNKYFVKSNFSLDEITKTIAEDINKSKVDEG